MEAISDTYGIAPKKNRFKREPYCRAFRKKMNSLNRIIESRRHPELKLFLNKLNKVACVLEKYMEGLIAATEHQAIGL